MASFTQSAGLPSTAHPRRRGAVEHLAGHQRREVGDRVADAALLGQRGDDLDGAQLLQLMFQGRQAGA